MNLAIALGTTQAQLAHSQRPQESLALCLAESQKNTLFADFLPQLQRLTTFSRQTVFIALKSINP